MEDTKKNKNWSRKIKLKKTNLQILNGNGMDIIVKSLTFVTFVLLSFILGDLSYINPC